jgi:rod shape-determining protein MreD
MKITLIVVFVLVVLFLQIGIMPNLKIFSVYPNIILLVILSLSILRSLKENIGWIIVSGLFMDFYGLYNVVGISIAALLLVSIFSQFLNRRFLKKENKLSLVFMFLASSLLYETILIVIFKIFKIEFNFAILDLIVKIVYNSILALPVFYLIKWYVDRVKKIQN